jgi:hypothetical protein
MLKENLIRQGVDLSFETNLLYLDVNNFRIGVNNAFPTVELDIVGDALFDSNLKISGTTITSENTNGDITLTPNGTGKVNVSYLTNQRVLLAGPNGSITDDANLVFDGTSLFINSKTVIVDADLGNLRINNNTISSINTNGNIELTPNGTGEVVASTLSVSDLTNQRVVLAGLNGSLTDSPNLTFDGTSLYIGGNSVLDSTSIGNIAINNLTISTLITNSNLYLTPNGTGVVVASALEVSDIVPGRIIYSGTSGRLQTESTLTYDASTNDLRIGNLSLRDNTISITDTNGSITIEPNGSGLTIIDSNTSLTVPVGGTGDRPLVPTAGMFRFNSGSSQLEYHDGSGWVSITPGFTSITSDEFFGDGSTLQFTLSQASTTTGTIISINGALQKPTTSYTVSGTVLLFTEAPQPGDVIEARTVVTTSIVSEIRDASTYLRADNTIPAIIMNAGTVTDVAGQSVGASLTVIDSWPMSSYDGAKYVVTISNSTARQISEILVTHDNSTAYINNHSNLNTGSSLVTFSVGVNSGNVELKATGAGAGNTVKVSRHLIG